MSTQHFKYLICFPESEIDEPHLTGKCCECGIILAINSKTFGGPVPEEIQTMCYRCASALGVLHPDRVAMTEAQKRDSTISKAFRELFGKVN